MNSDTWLYWYWGKEGTIDPDIPRFSKLLPKGAKILDLGCGTGRHTIFLAREGFRVYAFDQAQRAIERLQELLQREVAGDLQVETNVWDMTVFPYPYADSFFDGILSTRVIHHAKLETIKKIAEELARITRTGAHLYLQVPTEEKARRLQNERKEKLEQVELRTLIPAAGEEEAGVLHHYFTKEELLSTFHAFEEMDLRVVEEHYCLTAQRKEEDGKLTTASS